MREYWKTINCRMFDFQDFYTEVAKSLPDFSTIAEVGAADGASAIFLAETLLNMGKDFVFYVIDDMSYGGKHQMRTLMKNICAAGLGDRMELVPQPSVEAACHFPDVHFEFVFIDASHKFEWTKADILLWYRKVKNLRWLAGHDYNDGEGTEVKQAIHCLLPKKRVEVIETPGGHNVWRVVKQDARPLC